MTTKSIYPYLILFTALSFLSLFYIYLRDFRIIASVAIGLSYFLWGLWMHRHDRTLQLPIILEYFSFSLLAVIVLIFISLRV